MSGKGNLGEGQPKQHTRTAQEGKRGLPKKHIFRAAREVLPQICVVTEDILPLLKTLRKVTKGQCHLVTIGRFKSMKTRELSYLIPVMECVNAGRGLMQE